MNDGNEDYPLNKVQCVPSAYNRYVQYPLLATREQLNACTLSATNMRTEIKLNTTYKDEQPYFD